MKSGGRLSQLHRGGVPWRCCAGRRKPCLPQIKYPLLDMIVTDGIIDIQPQLSVLAPIQPHGSTDSPDSGHLCLALSSKTYSSFWTCPEFLLPQEAVPAHPRGI